MYLLLTLIYRFVDGISQCISKYLIRTIISGLGIAKIFTAIE